MCIVDLGSAWSHKGTGNMLDVLLCRCFLLPDVGIEVFIVGFSLSVDYM